MTFGEKIKARRQSLGLTLQQVGERCGVGKSTICKWENGRIADMGISNINGLARALEVPPAWLVDDLMSEEEGALVAAYRAANDAVKRDIWQILEAG